LRQKPLTCPLFVTFNALKALEYKKSSTFALGNKKNRMPMTLQTIDNYRLTSMVEPSDEVLAQLMREAAEEAKQKRAEATARFFRQLRQDAQKIAATW
jgi:peroxiredoxin family protein